MLLASARARSKMRRAVLVLAIMLNASGLSVASAGGGGRTADPNLSMTGITFQGTGSLATQVQTEALRGGLPGTRASILVIGTGVERALFPGALHGSIRGTGLTDPHGYGTAAVSTLLQLLPEATITSVKLGTFDGAAYDRVRLGELEDALRAAKGGGYDAVLLAFPPQAALDPIAHAIGHDRFGRFGTGLDLVTEALLSNPAGVTAIPAGRAARDAVFTGLNLTQREAIERFARQAHAWNAVVGAVEALDAAGVPVISPAGDFTRMQGDRPAPLPTQTIFGLAAHPSVITVGAAYADGARYRISPTSARGPTLDLSMKPDLVAPSDVMAMLPASARLPWPDDSLRVPLQTLRWAKAGVTPTPCPSVQSAYRCVLQGASIVSASVVAANIAASSIRAGARTDEVLRGLAWAQASRTSAGAPAWEQGAGVFGGLKGLDPAHTPVALARADLGDVSQTRDGTATIGLWDGGAPATADATISSFLGPNQSGAAVALPFHDPGRARITDVGRAIGVRAAAGDYQGGVYAGRVTLIAPGGEQVNLPLSFTQTLPLDAKASYAFNELQTGSIEGERVEDTTVALFAGLPTNVGLIGTAFKNLSGKATKNVGGDPTHNLVVRHAITKNSFEDPEVPAAAHGTARIPSVPPGFYKIHLLSDHGVEARQERGRVESLGIRLGSFGPEATFAPGEDVLLGAQPPCDGGPVAGPMADACVTRSGEVDPTTGFCTASNGATRVSFNVYCAPVSFAMPSAVVSRAVHLIEHDAKPAASEWRTCGLDLPVDGSTIDFGALVAEAEECDGSPGVASSWTFPAGAPGCLGPDERAAFPNGHPNDLRAVFKSAAAPGVPGRTFPVAVMTYRFALPTPNTYTVAAMSASYVADNAIVGVRFRTGPDALSDSANSVLVVDEPGVSVTPALAKAPTAGSSYNEWSVMSANAAQGQLSIIVIPTLWVRPDLNPTKPIAEVELCDVALRTMTFAKQAFGPAGGGTRQLSYAVADGGLTGQIDPSVSRIRPVFRDGAFRSAGVESEDVHLAVHIPKNTTREPSAAHPVLSPVGGPAHLSGVRAHGGGDVLPAGYRAHDPGYGTQVMDCSRDPQLASANLERTRNALACGAWADARADHALLAELSPNARLNGRFAGVLALDRATLARAGGRLVVETLARDDGGAFEQRWARADGALVRRFRVSDFYDDAVPFPLTPLSGAVSIARDGRGKPVLRVITAEVAGASHVISTVLE